MHVSLRYKTQHLNSKLCKQSDICNKNNSMKQISTIVYTQCHEHEVMVLCTKGMLTFYACFGV